jgi:hypothetical protein
MGYTSCKWLGDDGYGLMELREALTQISEIRQSMARSEVFRGYRSVTTAFSALVAVAASAVQAFWFPHNERQALYIWLAAAALSLIVVGAEMTVRYRRSQSPLQREITLLAVEQFAPCLVAGALMTYAMSDWAGNSSSMLPGLWGIVFSLGVFASRRVLPRGAFIVGAYYLLAGVLCIVMRGRVGFPIEMAATFGGGQLLAAGVLYWMLERKHGRQ